MFFDGTRYGLCFSQKTVVAVLDQMVNPLWPYLPKRQENYETEEEREAIEGVWNTISDDPLNYHFYYHVMDGDEGGRPPKILASDGHKQMENKYFNYRDKSCLHAIAISNNKVILSYKKCYVFISYIICYCRSLTPSLPSSYVFGRNQFLIFTFRRLYSILWSEC